jgi:hypothetical protein
MQFDDDTIPIHLLNDNRSCHLLEEQDSEGRTLLAALLVRISPGPFEFPPLGTVQLVARVFDGSAILGLKLDGRPEVVADLVWDSDDVEASWAVMQDFHKQFLGRAGLPLPEKTPPPPQSLPWLSILFFPDYHQRTPHHDRLLAVAMLWRLSHLIRLEHQNPSPLS